MLRSLRVPSARQSSAATDIGLTAQVYSYSRASGLFAGVALDGSALTIDHRSNEQFYGRSGILASEIIRTDAATAPVTAQNLVRHCNARHRGTTAAARPATPTATQPAAPSPQQANPGCADDVSDGRSSSRRKNRRNKKRRM